MGLNSNSALSAVAAEIREADDDDFAVAAACWLVVLFVSWFLAYFEGLLFLLVCGFFTIRWLLRRRWIAVGLYLLLLPTTFSAGEAVRDYWRGVGTFRNASGPAYFDPDYRITRSGHWCRCGPPSPWIEPVLYNLTLKLMIRTFGWQRGTYDGPHPTKEESLEALQAGVVVESQRLFYKDQVQIGDDAIKLDKQMGAELLHLTGYLLADSERRAGGVYVPPPIRAALWQERCLIIAMPCDNFEHPEKTNEVIVLIDRRKGRPYAFHQFGEPRFYAPPIRW